MKKSLIKSGIALGCSSLVVLGMGANAATIVDIGDYGVGAITPTIIPPTGVNNTYLNNMIGVYNGTLSSPIAGEVYTVMKGSLTPAAPGLPSSPSLGGKVSVDGSPTSWNIDLGAGGAGDYLVAQWDGPNGADAVYYIHGLTGTITLENTVDFVNANGGAYGLSDWWTANSVGVPDGGTTVLLLGTALSGLALIRRKLS